MTDLDHYKKTAEALAELLEYCTKDHNVRNHVGDWFWDPERGGKDFSKFGPVLAAARDDIRELERRQSALSQSSDDPRSEHYILCYSALRMDGYRYQEATDLDTEKLMDGFERTGDFGDATPLDKLALFFLLQRYLGKWGGERLTQRSIEWKAFRQLFLDTADVEVPEAFKPREWDAQKWEYRIKPRLRECVETVAAVHAKTKYNKPRKKPKAVTGKAAAE